MTDHTIALNEIGSKLAPGTRIWIYMANRPLSDDEIRNMDHEIRLFSMKWVSHNKALRADGGILLDRFAVLAVDESGVGASGCSIDSSIRFMKLIGEKYGVDWFDRTLITYQNEKGALETVSLDAFKKAYIEGSVTDETLVADTLVNTKKALKDAFFKPLSDSWHSRLV